MFSHLILQMLYTVLLICVHLILPLLFTQISGNLQNQKLTKIKESTVFLL